jgi:simple sugar transport system permease protein
MEAFILGLGLFLQTAAQMGTPILLATIGGILGEKAGHLNLGVEGMMLMGAALGFFAAAGTGNPALALLAAGLAGAFGALIYAFVTVTLRGNHVVTGLALTVFGSGVSSFFGKSLTGLSLPESIAAPFRAFDVPVLSGIPVLGDMLFKQSAYVHAALILAVLLICF